MYTCSALLWEMGSGPLAPEVVSLGPTLFLSIFSSWIVWESFSSRQSSQFKSPPLREREHSLLSPSFQKHLALVYTRGTADTLPSTHIFPLPSQFDPFLSSQWHLLLVFSPGLLGLLPARLRAPSPRSPLKGAS